MMRDSNESTDSGWLMVLDFASGKSASLFFSSAGRIGHPRWSPSGEKIAFALHFSGRRVPELHTIVSDGTQEQKFAEGEAFWDLNPSWLADGQSLYFLGMGDLVQVSKNGKILIRMPQSDISGEKDVGLDWVMYSSRR
jgi:Tol biopolymer transport system component